MRGVKSGENIQICCAYVTERGETFDIPAQEGFITIEASCLHHMVVYKSRTTLIYRLLIGRRAIAKDEVL